MPLDGSGLKRARIPPVWRLQLDLGPVAGFLRMDVQRSTTVLQVSDQKCRARPVESDQKSSSGGTWELRFCEPNGFINAKASRLVE
eukprot:1189270-Prorocentrum_minimum.AAC.4